MQACKHTNLQAYMPAINSLGQVGTCDLVLAGPSQVQTTSGAQVLVHVGIADCANLGHGAHGGRSGRNQGLLLTP